MIRNIYLMMACVIFLASCASHQNIDSTKQVKQTINDEMQAASELTTPEVEMPSSDILDELIPASNSIIDIDSELIRETTFDISVSNAPAKLFFKSLSKIEPCKPRAILEIKKIKLFSLMNFFNALIF